jgi:hypothetical protein
MKAEWSTILNAEFIYLTKFAWLPVELKLMVWNEESDKYEFQYYGWTWLKKYILVEERRSYRELPMDQRWHGNVPEEIMMYYKLIS